MKYKCEICGKREIVKRVYTETECLACRDINHQPQRSRTRKKKDGD